MCNGCCIAFKGWCKSFTRTEVILAVVEAILLLVFLAFFIFVILHLLVCSQPDNLYENITTTSSGFIIKEITTIPQEVTYYVPGSSETEIYKGKDRTTAVALSHQTLPRDLQCTWTPSKKTKATTHYYEEVYSKTSKSKKNKTGVLISNTTPYTKLSKKIPQYESEDESDGEEPNSIYRKFTVALVKMRRLQDILFGCILTIVSKYWTVTAASCIEAIEEVDTLDSFVMLENYGEVVVGGTHVIADVLIHPLYQGTNKSYDLAALRSETELTRIGSAVDLPELLDSFLITIGESFSILGYGGFRTSEKGARGRRLREVRVYSLPSRLCGEGREGGWAARHLERGGPVRAGECGAGAGAGAGAGGPVCAGPLYARGLPCHYCAGTPLLRARRLLAVMAATDHCAVACEPALYVNVAQLRDWLDALIDSP